MMLNFNIDAENHFDWTRLQCMKRVHVLSCCGLLFNAFEIFSFPL